MNEAGVVAVLMGGPSSESEVSLRSGQAVAGALREAGWTVHELPFFEAALPALPAGTQVVFPALHGVFGEDGQVQSLLAARGLPYVGSGPEASARIMSKQATKDCAVAAGVPIIPGVLLRDPAAPLPAALPLPLVVKPNDGGSTIGLSVVDLPEQWPEALAKAFAQSAEVVVERFIVGIELTVGLLDGTPLPPVEIRPPGRYYDNDAKYTYRYGQTQYFCPPQSLTAAQVQRCQELAVLAFRALGARDLLRVDFLLEKSSGAFYLLEANSLPGFTATSLMPKAAAVAGIAFPALCDRLVRQALARASA